MKANKSPSAEDRPAILLAPFNLLEPFELALLAVLLSKGKNPKAHLSMAATLWAEAFQYVEDLNDLFWGEGRPKMKPWQVLSLGENDEWLDTTAACAKYSWGKRHLRDLLKDSLPPHVFNRLWQSGSFPKTLLDRLDELQAQKRSARSQKAVKRRKST